MGKLARGRQLRPGAFHDAGPDNAAARMAAAGFELLPEDARSTR